MIRCMFFISMFLGVIGTQVMAQYPGMEPPITEPAIMDPGEVESIPGTKVQLEEPSPPAIDAQSAEAAQSDPAIIPPTDDQVRQVVHNHIMRLSQSTGLFDMQDPKTMKIRRLVLIQIHPSIEKAENFYKASVVFKDIESGDLVDVAMTATGLSAEQLNIVDVRIDKVNGENYAAVLPETPQSFGAQGLEGQNILPLPQVVQPEMSTP